MGQDLVVVEGLTKVFPHGEKDVDVLKGIDLTIEEGEMLSIVGKSGAGKSTLLHLLGTLDLPTAGRILYDGNDVTAYSSSRLAEFRNQTIGFVFQFHHLLPEFDAVENVMMPGLIRGTARGPLEKEAKKLLDEVGLSHRLTHRPGELSGGEQQRVALARALVMRPRLILADEPTGNLDTGTSDAIHRLFFDLNKSRGLTFLIVTHSRDLAAKMPRIVTMVDGRVDRDDRRPVGENGEAAQESAPDTAEHASQEAEDSETAEESSPGAAPGA
ncbi:MAG: ABC transporter ATP-binding protein [Deltaproteobacteria bacterium]|nr:MAG: ABC transporter ATP-binding protein [Deltaproteobacteria bacterium]